MRKILIMTLAVYAITFMTGCAVSRPIKNVDCSKEYNENMSVVFGSFKGYTETEPKNLGVGWGGEHSVKLEMLKNSSFSTAMSLNQKDEGFFAGAFWPAANNTTKSPGEYYLGSAFCHGSVNDMLWGGQDTGVFISDIADKIYIKPKSLVYLGDINIIYDKTMKDPIFGFPIKVKGCEEILLETFGTMPASNFFAMKTNLLTTYAIYVQDNFEERIKWFKANYPIVYEKYKDNIVNYAPYFLHGK